MGITPIRNATPETGDAPRQPFEHITELFCLDDHDFLNAGYQLMLGRMPDEPGFRYYLGRLCQGYSRESVLLQLSRSSEYRRPPIRGLEQLLKSEARLLHRLWRYFVRFSRVEGYHRLELHQLRRLLTHAAIRRLESVSTAASRGTESPSRLQDPPPPQQYSFKPSQASASQPPRATGPMGSEQNTPSDSSENRLSEAEVRQAYRTVLGREPESIDAIEHHSNAASLDHLYSALLNSAEFRARFTSTGKETATPPASIDPEALEPTIKKYYLYLRDMAGRTLKS